MLVPTDLSSSSAETNMASFRCREPMLRSKYQPLPLRDHPLRPVADPLPSVDKQLTSAANSLTSVADPLTSVANRLTPMDDLLTSVSHPLALAIRSLTLNSRGAAPKHNLIPGRAKPFRTSGGKAAAGGTPAVPVNALNLGFALVNLSSTYPKRLQYCPPDHSHER